MEPRDLEAARRHLALAEAMLMTEQGLSHLQEGLALLDSVIANDRGTESEAVACNVGRTYTNSIWARIRRALADDAKPAEPELEHWFSVVRAFDGAGFDLPPDAAALKVAVVRRLVDYYYEGYAEADKTKIYAELAELAGRARDAGAASDE